MNKHEQPRLQAEKRARATLEQAQARAEAVALQAEERVKALIDGHERKIQEPDCQALGMDCIPLLSRCEKIAREYINRHLPSTELFREVVSIRAYYKAERRDFGEGQDALDWLEAEQEVLDVPTFGNPAGSQ